MAGLTEDEKVLIGMVLDTVKLWWQNRARQHSRENASRSSGGTYFGGERR